MILRSPTESALHVALTSGHTCVIETGEGTDVPAIFIREALARGAIPGGVELDQPESEPAFDRNKAITDVLNSMLDGGDEQDFTSGGKPDLRRVNAKLGFQASRSEVDAVWTEITKAKVE
ncbi:hypothetical protein [Aquabacterium sp.]|uniref:hypothetical protein n=1 Tax=Aquabacterium sp. TaxID=1872578 RepID=UPI0035B441FB